MAYRYRGHSMADPSAYRDSSEVELWKKRDPIEAFKVRMFADGLLGPADVARIEKDVEATVAEAARFAEESPEPALQSIHDHVYG
jgi:pyruvate dehydrogenase E1 component alpha subunit